MALLGFRRKCYFIECSKKELIQVESRAFYSKSKALSFTKHIANLLTIECYERFQVISTLA